VAFDTKLYFCIKQLTMRKQITLSILFLCTIGAFAQQSGTVQYQETRKLDIHFDGDMPPPPGLPTEHTNKTLLFFNDVASLYKNDTANTDNMNVDRETEDGGHVFIQMAAPDNQIYCDLANKKMIQQRDFMQRKFLIEGEMLAEGYKLTGKQKMILNYPCSEAIKIDSTKTMVLWYTPAIPVSSGPFNYVGLPGLVLEVNINNGEQIITALSVSKEVNLKNIVKPKDGKKVTQEEFDKIVEEKMKEMGVEGGRPGVVIKIEND